MKQVHLQPAYVLHRRAYRESSFLIEIFTRDFGRLTVVARGVRAKKNQLQGILQPFIPLRLSWAGKTELMTLTQAETSGDILPLMGECLFAGFYLNELLIALLEKWDAHPVLYDYYVTTVGRLQLGVLKEKTLRAFEKFFLTELGYGFLPKSDVSLSSVVEEKYYRFVPEQGFVMSELGQDAQAKTNIFSGKSLRAIAQENWDDEQVLRDAKRLSRIMLMPLLGARTLHSRRLFMPLGEEENAE